MASKPPEPIEMQDYVNKYVKFAKALIQAEKEASIPEDKQSTPERIHEAFRFWYVDCRDREDLARAIEMDERERKEDRSNNDRFWEDDDEDV